MLIPLAPELSDASGKRKRRTSSGALNTESDGATDTPESKRRRANGTDAAGDESDAAPDVAAGPGRLLSKEVRDAIAVVLAQ